MFHLKKKYFNQQDGIFPILIDKSSQICNKACRHKHDNTTTENPEFWTEKKATTLSKVHIYQSYRY